MPKPITKKFGSRWYTQIPEADIMPNDLIEFRDKDHHVHWLKLKNRTKKGSLRSQPRVWTGPPRMVLHGSIIIHPSNVICGWTKRK